MPNALRREEELARLIVAEHLRADCHQHDDGSGMGMFDLRVGPVDRPAVAIEVTSAVDEEYIKTWNTGPGKGPIFPELPDTWGVEIRPGANIKRLRTELADVLASIAASDREQVVVDDVLRHRDRLLFQRLDALGVTYVHRTPSGGRGTVHFTMPGDGGAVDGTGSQVCGWLDGFLREDSRSDNLRKLASTSAVRRELFVWVDLAGAPWSVVSYLTDLTQSDFSLPTAAPNLPSPLTGVWLVATVHFGERLGVRWDGAEWQRFAVARRESA